MDEDGQPGSRLPAPAKAESSWASPADGSAAEGDASTASLADRAARLRADRDLRDMLAAQGFAGPAYAVFEEELAGYGYQVMMDWLRTGYIFIQCRNTGIGLPSWPIPAHEREDLAQETVAEALGAFRQKGLREGGWRPDRGASLKTYFTGALCLQFANSWKKRLRATGTVTVSSLEMLPSDTESGEPGPAEISWQRDAIRRGLADIKSDITRVALVLAADGYEQEEIAEILGPDVTPKSIEGCLRRHRRNMRNGNGER
jgi:DNA-directed RNA polymerase specialized sigma24 family protein